MAISSSFSSYELARIRFHYYVLNYFPALSEFVVVFLSSYTTRCWYTLRDIIWFCNVCSFDSYSLTFDEISNPQINLPLVVRKQVVDKGVVMTYNIVGTSTSIKGNTNIDRKWNERLQIKTPGSLSFKLFSNTAN